MSGRANHVDQMDAITKVIEIVPHAVSIKAHVLQIIENPAFKGSRRSQQFLQFVVESALDGHFDELKERTLGIKLFGRAPAYNTADDAIVRVTACDVRKRLANFYSNSGIGSEFRIELPLGSYIPEFRRIATHLPDLREATGNSIQDDQPDSIAVPLQVRRYPFTLTHFAYACLGLAICLGILFWQQKRSTLNSESPGHVLPWSALIQPNRQTQVIFCDPEIVNVQRLFNSTLSLSDYANQHYWPNPASFTPEQQSIMRAASFRGVSVAAVDAGIALRIANRTMSGTQLVLETHTARSIRLADFKTEDSFILFGSPRSNPWLELFQNQLDFSFEFDETRKSEFIRNKRPQSGEVKLYVPTAQGWGTGQAYAILALVGNPNQSGQVLVIAGSNAEATEAAGKLATDLPLLSKTLNSHGIDPHGPPRHFEIVLRVSTMAGSSNTFEVIAVHTLPNRSS